MISQKQLLQKAKDGHLIDFLLAEIDKNPVLYANNLFLSYGSLRKDEYNYTRMKHNFGQDSLIYLDTFDVNRLIMYDLGPYPAAVPVDTNKLQVKCDLMYCSDAVYEYIYDMEISAGYRRDNYYIRLGKDDKENNWNNVASFNIFLADSFLIKQISKTNCNVVPGGDWLQYQEIIKTTSDMLEVVNINKKIVCKEK